VGPATLFCEQCGAPRSNPPAHFCGRCGAALPVSAPAQPIPPRPELLRQVARYQMAGFTVVMQDAIRTQLTRPKRPVAHWAAVLLALLLIGPIIIPYLLYHRFLKKDDDVLLEVDRPGHVRACGRGIQRSTLYRTMKVLVIALLGIGGIIVWGIVVDAFMQQGAGPDAGWGVHVCSGVDFNGKDAACAHATRTVRTADLAGAYLNATGKGGAHFSSTTLTAIVSTVQVGGSWLEAGRMELDCQLSYNTEAWSLPAVLSGTSVTPKPGVTYRIEVDETSASHAVALGSATFTLAP